MKAINIIFALFLITISASAQENMITLSGGYSFANIEDSDTNTSGFRINGLYEFNPSGGAIAHGLSIGYIGTSADVSVLGNSVATYKINSWPIYYAPKFLFGGESVKGFVKGALGMQFSSIKKTGGVLGGEITGNDTGFYGGVGAGFLKTFNEKFFINVEYEWAYMSNSFYKDGFMNSIMGGVGVKF
jgi:hypothetical protein